MLLKTGTVVIRTEYFKNRETGKLTKAKYIWQASASNVVDLPGKGDLIFIPNEDGGGDDLEVVSIDHDLGINQTTINVTADINSVYSDLRGPNAIQGLYRKYEVTKTSGKPTDPDAKYFVLRIDTDQSARVAMATYADEMERSGNPQFAKQIREMIEDLH